jgi:hypothetical protein
VFVTHKLTDAVVTATWLTGQGVPARVMDEMTLGGLQGLTAWVPGVSLHGIEVWVEDLDHVSRARELLVDHEAFLGRRAQAAEAAGPIEAVCEECGESSVYAGNQIGTIQDCPHCGAYVDVESSDADTESADEFGEQDEES